MNRTVLALACLVALALTAYAAHITQGVIASVSPPPTPSVHIDIDEDGQPDASIGISYTQWLHVEDNTGWFVTILDMGDDNSCAEVGGDYLKLSAGGATGAKQYGDE